MYQANTERAQVHLTGHVVLNETKTKNARNKGTERRLQVERREGAKTTKGSVPRLLALED